MSNFFDLLIDKTLPIDHDRIKAVHAKSIETRKAMGEVFSRFRDAANDYRAKVTAVLTSTEDVDQKKEKLRLLRESVFQRATKTLDDPDNGWMKRLQEEPNSPVAREVIGTYFQLFTDMGFFNAAINLYERIPDSSELKGDSDILVGLANSYNYRTIETKSASGPSQYTPNPDPKKALEIAERLERQFGGLDIDYSKQYLEPKIAGIKARAEILLSEEVAKTAGGNADAVRREGLQKAHKLYKDSFTFENGYHHYLGYNAMLTAALLGDMDEAKKIAPKLYLSAMRDNGIFANDPLTVFRTTMAMVIAPEALNISPDAPANNTLNNALASLQNKVIIEPWQKYAFLRDAKKLMEATKGDSPTEKRIHYLLEERVIPALTKTKIFKPVYVGSDDNRRALLDYASYTTAANSIIPGAGAGKGVVLGGNLNKGGLIPDLTISSQVDYFSILPLVSTPLGKLEEALHVDGHIFPERMRDKTLKDLALTNHIGGESKTGDFYEAIRLLVRETFHTKSRNMENMASQGHNEFEEGLRNLYALTGMSHEDMSALKSKDTGDREIFAKSPSAANMAHLMAMRLGDCRMYKVASGLFHRIASAAAQNEIIHSLDKGEMSVETALNKARDIRRVQLVNFDLDLYSEVEMGSKTWADRGDTGYYVKSKDGKMGYIEPHSVNLLVERTPTGEIENLFLACTFYNGEYRDEKATESDGKTKKILPGATYDLRVPITRDMVKREDKGPGQKPEFTIDLTGKTGFQVFDPETGKPTDQIKVIAKSSKYSHANAMEYGPTNTRRLYTGDPSSFLSAKMPPFIDLERAWDRRLDVRASMIASEVDNIRHDRPPAVLPPETKGAALDDAKRAVG